MALATGRDQMVCSPAPVRATRGRSSAADAGPRSADVPEWARDGQTWPHHAASRFARAAGMTWHAQRMGQGPVILLLHGTGASTHSWRDLLPILAERFCVIAIDLPGHGFTQSGPRELLSLYGMSLAIHALLRKLDVQPTLVVGHSAGAAIAVQMCIDGRLAPRAIIGVNAALLPFRGVASHLFSPLAKLLTRIPFVTQIFARRACDRAMIKTMIADTGSTISDEGIDLYWRLAQQPSHIAAAFRMMAEWDLWRLEKDLRRLRSPLALLTGTNDRTIPPSDAERVRAILPATAVVRLRGLGHLAHEERPQLVAERIFEIAESSGAWPEPG